MPEHPLPQTNSRLGLHYYPDTHHYRLSDLHTWLPELRSLGVSWLTLNTPPDRAVPEYFLRGIIAEEIEPILRFTQPLDSSPSSHDLTLLFSTYARWGVNYIVLYDRPNSHAAWASSSWSQNDLVEQFLDHFIPAARTALRSGLTPVFPPLEPGGDYWDITFLRLALQGLRRRGQSDLLLNLIMSAVAQAGQRPLNWGMGGPERWPGAKPYQTPENQQDQRGFRIFDWYLTISQAVIGKPVPIILFEAGSYPDDEIESFINHELPEHTDRNFAIIQALTETRDSNRYVPKSLKDDPGFIPEQVLACNFWLLASNPQDQFQSQAWYKSDGQTLPIVEAVRQFQARHIYSSQPHERPSQPGDQTSVTPLINPSTGHPIDHYLLLPLFEWGISDWYLDVIRPFVKKYHPAIGFSLREAALAARVTVIASRHLIPEDQLDRLRAVGCVVERIDGDGTSIATELASR